MQQSALSVLEQHAAWAVAFECDGAVGRDHRARVESGERDIGHYRDVERRAAGNDPFERVPELEAEEAGPESRAQRVDGGETLRALCDHRLDGLDADDRRVPGPDRDRAGTTRDLPEEGGGDTVGSAHPVTVLPPRGRGRAEIATPRRYDGWTVSPPSES